MSRAMKWAALLAGISTIVFLSARYGFHSPPRSSAAQRTAVGMRFEQALLVTHDVGAAAGVANLSTDEVAQAIRKYWSVGMTEAGTAAWDPDCSCLQVQVRSCPYPNGQNGASSSVPGLNVDSYTFEVDVSDNVPPRVELYGVTGGGSFVPVGNAQYPQLVKERAACIASGRLKLPTPTAPAARRQLLDLRARVIGPGEFTGYARDQTTLWKTVKGWVAGWGLDEKSAKSWSAKLHRDEFSGALTEHLTTSALDAGDALSWVTRFRSRAAAAAEVMTTAQIVTLSQRSGASSQPFPVLGIPGARGIHSTSSRTTVDNIVFSDGTYVYLVGDGAEKHALAPPPQAALIAAARRLYQRVHALQLQGVK